jgi:hypothetical protein
MATGIGAASDYYRVRTMRFDTVDSPAFEWREDVLYRRPKAAVPSEVAHFRVEAVALDDDDDVTVLGEFSTPEDAHEASAAAMEDLALLTRSEFEERYFPAGV